MAGMRDYWEKERSCEAFFRDGGPYYLLTSSQWPWLMYTNDEEFIQGANLLPLAMAGTDMCCLDEIVMNNHMHAIMEGRDAVTLKIRLKDKTTRLQRRLGHAIPVEWDLQFLELKTLEELRRAVCYTDRNAYVARKDATPSGYRWGAGNLFFNGNIWLHDKGVAWKDLTYREKRKICHSHELDLPAGYRIKDGLILPSSYVNYQRTESFFHSAHQYFAMLSRHAEADLEVARQIGEVALLPNEEVYKVVQSWYHVPIRKMTQQQRLEAVRRMKTDLSSNNKQIAQVLSIPLSFINEMYPIPH